MKVLVACEESQRVCISFRERGHEAYSCDLLPCSGGHPEWHIQKDVIPLLNENWDIIIAHPPCTYLTSACNRSFDTGKYGKHAWERMRLRNEAIAFFYKFVIANCRKIAIENPVGIMSTAFRKPDQIVQPYQFGDPYEKRTCFWLKGLPKLIPTEIVEPEPRRVFASANSMPEWYCKLANLPKEIRSKERSKTFWGIARAMAEQWG